MAPVALNYGVYLANEQKYDSAGPVLKRALVLNNSSFVAAYYLAHVCLALGDINGAKAATLRAEANALRPEERERIKQLKMRF
jgi:predicted Zn-dependent protease